MRHILYIIILFSISCRDRDTVQYTPNNKLSGSVWRVESLYYNYALIDKDDTVSFIDGRYYLVGSDTSRYEYSLYNTPAHSVLTLKTFLPINGLTLCASNLNDDILYNTRPGNSVQLVFVDIWDNTDEYITTLRKIK